LTSLAAGALAVAFVAPPATAHAITGDLTEEYEGSQDHPTESCFWKTLSNDRLWNYVNTDSNSVYQCSVYKLPEGSELIVRGEYPHVRYMTFSIYGTVLGNFLTGQDIVPDEGSENPLVYGNDRFTKDRSYTMFLKAGDAPEGEEIPPNTMYHGGAFSPLFGNVMCIRLYVSDRGTEPFGGTELPDVTLALEDGTELEGEEMCESVEALNHGFGAPPQAIGFNLGQYLALREGSRLNPMLPDRPHTWPASDPPDFKAFFNAAFMRCSFFTPEIDCGDDTYNPDGVGLGNAASRYMESYLDNGFGRVLVLRGKLPTTPRTLKGQRRVPDEDYQLRYFSICPQESLATWRVGDCIFDEELAENLDEDGFYSLVLSSPSYRPRNANSKCGYSWAPTPPAGDGAGDLNLYNMWIRQALPSPNYEEALANVEEPGTEQEVMGDYYPRGTYYTIEEFEALGCPNPGQR